MINTNLLIKFLPQGQHEQDQNLSVPSETLKSILSYCQSINTKQGQLHWYIHDKSP